MTQAAALPPTTQRKDVALNSTSTPCSSPPAPQDPAGSPHGDGHEKRGCGCELSWPRYFWDLLPWHAQTVLVCCIFMAAGPVLIVMNARIFTRLQYPYPATVSSWGMISSSLIVHVLVAAGQVPITRRITKKFFLQNVLPIGLLSSATVVLGNIVYLYLSIAFIQMLKALTPVYILLGMFAFRLERPTVGIIFAVLIISVGTGISSVGELRFSVIGFILQSFADVVEGLKLVLQDVLLKRIKLSPFETLYYVAPASLVFQIMYILVRERDALHWDTGGRMVKEHGTVMLIAASMGFIVNISGFLVMKRTSGLVVKLLSILRSNGLVVGTFLLLPGNEVTRLQWLGYSIAMVGFVWYTVLKQVPSRAPEQDKNPEDPEVDDRHQLAGGSAHNK